MRKEDIQRNTRLAGLVRRYHTWPVIRHQTTAEHSWQVARLYLEIFGSPRAEVWQYVLLHDQGEVQVGDPPYPIKARNPALKAEMDRLEDAALESMGIELPEISDEERVRFKFCDLLDCAEYGMNEVATGNKYMEPVADQSRGLVGLVEKMRTEEDRRRAARFCYRKQVALDWNALRDLYDDKESWGAFLAYVTATEEEGSL